MLHRCRYVQEKARLYCCPEELERALALYHRAVESARQLAQIVGRPFCFEPRQNQQTKD